MRRRQRKKPRYLVLAEFGNPILRRATYRVKKEWISKKSSQELFRGMRKVMHRARGVGFAANQVGRRERAAIIEVRKGNRRFKRGFPFTVIVNPRIFRRSKAVSYDWEGCLSLSSVRGKVPRARSINVSYRDALGKPVKRKLSGFPARVFQHEIDHLDGILYVDRMKDMKTLMTLTEFGKRVAKKKKSDRSHT